MCRRGPTSRGIAEALVHVERKLGGQVWPQPSKRATWVVLWALAAAYPWRSPMQWAPSLDVDPNIAAVMLARVRTMRWFSWRLVVEAMALLIMGEDA